MRINRAVGAIVFLVLVQIVMSDVFRAISASIVATLGAVEIASQTASLMLIEHQ